MDVFDPAGVLIPAAKKSPSVARDLAMVGGGLLRLGGAAVDAHLDVLRRERAALDQVEALKVQLAEREAGLCYASERAVEALRRMTPAEGRALLVEAGIITSDGELTSEYR